MEAVYIHNTLEKKTILTLLPEAKIITNVENAICIKKLLFFGIIDQKQQTGLHIYGYMSVSFILTLFSRYYIINYVSVTNRTEKLLNNSPSSGALTLND